MDGWIVNFRVEITSAEMSILGAAAAEGSSGYPWFLSHNTQTWIFAGRITPLLVNNRSEGNAPLTVQALRDLLRT